jgi:cysteine-rich repeat protein
MSHTLLRFILQLKTRALDRMAINTPNIPPSRRIAIMNTITTRIASLGRKWEARIQDFCPTFAATYGRSVSDFLSAIEPRANCVVGAAYVQTTVTCPRPVCGNGIVEPGEVCDDGNDVDTDSCHNDCTPNP